MEIYHKIMVAFWLLMGLTACEHRNQPSETTEPQHKKTTVDNLKPLDDMTIQNLMQQGIWYDPKTGLYWDRCSVGQTWDGKTCQGKALRLPWQDAKDYVKQFTNQHAKGGYTDWRVPTIEELSSIRYCSNGWQMAKDNEKSILTEKGSIRVMSIPANDGGEIQVPDECADGFKVPIINQQIFPNTNHWFYWSGSSDTDYNNNAWGVDFYHGYNSNYHKTTSGYVRAVRSDE